jgi:hypothetical protein
MDPWEAEPSVLMKSNDASPNATQTYSSRVKRSLERQLGKSAAEAVLYYTGEPDPSTFEDRLRRFFGVGADAVLKQLAKDT